MTEETIFEAVLDKSTPAERSAYLDEVCAGDAALRQRVEGLLLAHDRAGAFLDRPAFEQLVADDGRRDGQTEAVPCPPEDEALGRGRTDDKGETQAEPVNGEQSLDFLTPSEKPGSLGRLDHYEVLEVVGHGGMGVVLKAFDEKLHRVVAIKVLAPQLATSATARKRFTREAQAAAAVTHDHIVTIHAVDNSGRLPYLVMQLVPGASLQDRLDRTGPLDLKEVLRIGMQTAAGLAAAHAQGLVHRDIKPANILLENGIQRVKITDFGLARAADDASLTQSGVIAGTPQYMAPEQARGETVDRRADLFSLGSVLYAACTGRPPFRASGALAVLKRVCEDTPRPIQEINPDIPDGLCDIIGRLHAKNPAGRFQSAAEVAEILGQHLARLQMPVAAGLLPADSEASKSAGCKPAATAEPTRAPRRRRWIAAAAAVLLVLTAGLGVTETTGVTHLRGTVIRLFTPRGTLVVEATIPE